MKRKIALDDGHGAKTLGKRTPTIKALGGACTKENTCCCIA
ncbi:hypothetical protein ACR6HW_08330 [Fusibacter sp. JL298sf-3]